MNPTTSSKHPFLVLSFLLGQGALLGAASPSASAKAGEAATPEGGGARVVLETHSVRDLGHGYAVARAFVYSPQGIRGAMSMAVDGCGDDHGHIVMSLNPVDIDLYTWHAGGTHFYDRLAMTACKNR
ncbi:MAG TPA: hypothetical protein VMH26_03940 [Burkholderiales bacterium]|nr:hypothetical protein [Burkholderiales bacterium]